MRFNEKIHAFKHPVSLYIFQLVVISAVRVNKLQKKYLIFFCRSLIIFPAEFRYLDF